MAMESHETGKVNAGITRVSWMVVFALVCMHLSLPAQAASLSKDPVLRIETDMHTARINRIDVDQVERYLVTASSDKTVRVWELVTGTLLRVLRVPIGDGKEGRVDAVAMSSDGVMVAAGGWSAKEAPGDKHSIYLFDRASGKIVHRISGLPSVILDLAYSQEDRFLAVALSGTNGIRIYRTSDYAAVGKDTQYASESYSVDFAKDGRLVTTSLDGHVRLYDRDFTRIAKVRATGGSQPYFAHFSPDGTQVAVGFLDSTKVNVLSATDLSFRFATDTAGIDTGSLSRIAWSQDGRRLYAGGLYDDGTGVNPILMWSKGGRGPAVRWSGSQDTILDLKPLAGGRLVLGAADPTFAVLDSAGRTRLERRPEIPDHRATWKRFRVSHDARVVEFGFNVFSSDGQWNRRLARWTMEDRRLSLDPPGPASQPLNAPLTRAPDLDISGWDYTTNPRLNGQPLVLKPNETSFSLAISSDGLQFLLGTHWYIRLFDRAGVERWMVPVPGAWAVNMSGDQQFAVAALRDGTIRWYRMRDGQEVLALFSHTDGQRWITWTPTGYYQASAGAEDLIGWHLNQGPNTAAAFYGISRFREQFYRPDVITRVLKTGDEQKALQLADQARGERTVVRNIRALRPPTISILAPASGEKVKERKLALTYEARSETGAITHIEARVGARKTQPLRHTPTYRNNHQYAIGQITVEIPAANTVVELLAYNDNGPSESARYTVNWSGTADVFKPNLYVLAAGVSDYPGTENDLKYAAKDARDFVRAIRRQEGKLYKRVHVRHLDDTQAKHGAILKGLNWIERETTSRDVAIVYLAGHGVNDARGRYRFLPSDYQPGNMRLTTIKGSDLKEFLEAIAGKTILFFDTCYSGNALKVRGAAGSKPDIDKVANELADSAVGVIVFASTTQGALHAVWTV